MKRIVLVIIASMAFGFPGSAQTDTAKVDSTGEQILQELKIIRGLQQEAKDQRVQAVKDKHRRDSLENRKNEEDLSTDYSVMAKIEDNTRQDPVRDGWNVYGWIAFLLAAFSAIVAWITFSAQSKTEQHTKNAPLSAQIGRFKDLTRHLYRNLVCTSAAIARYNANENTVDAPVAPGDDKEHIAYPSESNFNKLKTMPDDVILNVDVNERTYALMHELKVLLRNYNIEIDVASRHVSNGKIWDRAIRQDFDNLIFKPLHLIRSAFEPEELMLSTDSGRLSLPDRSVYIILEEHFEKLKGNFNTLGSNVSYNLLHKYFEDAAPKTESEVAPDVSPEQGQTVTAEAASRAAAGKYNACVDVTGALIRALNGFVKAASEQYGSSMLNEQKTTLVVKKEAFLEFLRGRDAQLCKDIQGHLKENRRLLRNAKRSLLWPVDREQKMDRVALIESAISKLEKKLTEVQNRDPKKTLEYFVGQLSGVGKLEAFKESGLVTYNQSEDGRIPYEKLHASLLPYLKFISEDAWDFRKLIYVILAVDSSIEANRIGMVNYE